jgi:thiol-disulfide isomerase/thioredoxin
MNFPKNLINWIKTQCNDDETCVMIVFVIIGFLLCYLFSNQISGYINFAPFDGENGAPVADGATGLSDRGTDVGMGRGVKDERPIGIELKKRTIEPTPSTERQLKVMGSKPSLIQPPPSPQRPGLTIEDSMMFRPFDEIWNPGFMPLDMVFKDIKKQAPVGPMGPMGPDRPMKPMGPDRPMKPMGPVGPVPMVQDVAPTPTQGQGQGGDLKIILVYAPWCGHSKKMLPDFEKIKSEYDGQTVNGNKVSILMYNSDVDKDKVKEYQVKGFPTLFVEKNGQRQPFPHRTYEKISEYIKSA